jgi:hypothetical protein
MIKYNVNYEKKTVTAYFEGDKKYWVNSLMNMVYKITNGTDAIYYTCDISPIVSQYQLNATVKCHPSDTFNEELGKELAKEKLNEKFNRCKIQILKMIANDNLKQFNIINERITAKAKKGARN